MAKKSEKNTVSIGFEQQIWSAADILRGNMDAAEYKHVALWTVMNISYKDLNVVLFISSSIKGSLSFTVPLNKILFRQTF